MDNPIMNSDVQLQKGRFGTYAPRGLTRLLIKATRESFLGRGEPRRLVWLYLRALGQKCYDLPVNGAEMRLYPLDNSVERALILRPQKVYPKELAFLKDRLSEGGVFLDIGANIGAFSLTLAGINGVSVIAVEAAPSTAARLLFNVEASQFDNVDVVEKALSDSSGIVEFQVHSSDLKLSGIGVRESASRSVNVETISLIELLHERHVDRVKAMKIDIEGHEDQALLPFFDTAPTRLWPETVLIEAFERQGIPKSVERMKSLGYTEAFRTKMNLGLIFEQPGGG